MQSVPTNIYGNTLSENQLVDINATFNSKKPSKCYEATDPGWESTLSLGCSNVGITVDVCGYERHKKGIVTRN